MNKDQQETIKNLLTFHLGLFGALLPFLIFIAGVILIALSGAPDEKGFWPILILAIALGLILAKNKKEYSRTIIKGMSQEIVMIMITAWMLASIIGVLMTATGFVEALSWVSAQLNLNGSGFVVSTFIICGLVSLSTGSSFATILICGPLLYPSGGLLGAHLPSLAGAIIAGATLGDFSAPISDTTIASTLSQQAPIGPTVKSRIKYILPIAILAILFFYVSSIMGEANAFLEREILEGRPLGLVMLAVPVFIIYLFLKGKHLLHGLMFGLLLGVGIGLILGILTPGDLLSLDLENFTAKSLVIDGINRAVGISFFTILLLGLVETLKASGLIDHIVQFASKRTRKIWQAEAWIAGTVGGAVLLTTHSIVAILMVKEFAQKTGESMKVSPIRRANILSMVVCLFPFVLPYCIPVILMANMTNSGADYGIETVSPWTVGMYNFVAWGLGVMVIISILFGYGRKQDAEIESKNKDQRIEK